jgi:hypothetical protein
VGVGKRAAELRAERRVDNSFHVFIFEEFVFLCCSSRGNSAMAAEQLPDQSIRLSTVGFRKLYRLARTSNEQARAVADEIEGGPRAFIQRVFILTDHQKEVLGGLDDHEVHERVSVLLTELRSESPGELRYQPSIARKDGEGPPPPRVLTGSCKVLRVSS